LGRHAAPGRLAQARPGASLAHPILINRPFVLTQKGVRLCRPSELVLDILPLPQKGGVQQGRRRGRDRRQRPADAEEWMKR
jgi:hypothetical protein